MEPEDLVAGRYRIASMIGRGAMGVVWLAKDERLGRPVAIKQLLPAAAPELERETVGRAEREARIAARLRHPNAIAVHDIVTHEDRPCLVMEYLRSESLAERADRPIREVAAIGAQVAAALTAAHAAGIVHRDIKPDNVLITEDGTAKITDFGVSRATGLASVTQTGILAGTPAYLAPEVAAGGDADSRSDVFSLGATLYAAIEGQPPFGVHNNPIVLLQRVAKGELIPPRHAGKLTHLLLWLLRRDPAERPTMQVAQQALATAAKGRSITVPPPRNPTLGLPRRRGVSRRVVAACVAGAVLLAAGIVVGVLLANKDDTTPGLGAAGQSTTAPTQAAPTCSADYVVTKSWPDGYEVAVTVRADQELTGWTVSWALPAGHDVVNLWQGVLDRLGTTVTVTNADYNVTVPAGGTTTFGFTGSGPGAGDAQDRPVPEVTCQQR